MRKVFLGIVIGVVISYLAFWGYTTTKNYLFRNKLETKIIKSVERLFVRIFPDIKFHSIGIKPSNAYVNYSHDKLFKVSITYERENKIKKIQLNIGTYNRGVIVPPELEILALDRKAEVLFNKDRK
jgi:hypothetical protein